VLLLDMYVITGQYLPLIKEKVSQATDSVYIISPYITDEVLHILLMDVKAPVVVISSWRKSEFASGIASLSLANKCRENDWEFRIFHDGHKRKLHSKMYVIDDKIFFGSANLTNSGFQLSEHPNYEILTSADMNSNWKAHLDELVSRSQLLDGVLYDFFAEKVGQLPHPEPSQQWKVPPVGLKPSFGEDECIIANDIDVTALLWGIMPPKPTYAELQLYKGEIVPLDLFGCRWGSFRRVLYQQSISRDIVDDLIDEFYDLMIRKYPNDLSNSYREPGGHTECLVWKI